jgi:hypothetical protein
MEESLSWDGKLISQLLVGFVKKQQEIEKKINRFGTH